MTYVAIMATTALDFSRVYMLLTPSYPSAVSPFDRRSFFSVSANELAWTAAVLPSSDMITYFGGDPDEGSPLMMLRKDPVLQNGAMYGKKMRQLQTNVGMAAAAELSGSISVLKASPQKMSRALSKSLFRWARNLRRAGRPMASCMALQTIVMGILNVHRQNVLASGLTGVNYECLIDFSRVCEEFRDAAGFGMPERWLSTMNTRQNYTLQTFIAGVPWLTRTSNDVCVWRPPAEVADALDAAPFHPTAWMVGIGDRVGIALAQADWADLASNEYFHDLHPCLRQFWAYFAYRNDVDFATNLHLKGYSNCAWLVLGRVVASAEELEARAHIAQQSSGGPAGGRSLETTPATVTHVVPRPGAGREQGRKETPKALVQRANALAGYNILTSEYQVMATVSTGKFSGCDRANLKTLFSGTATFAQEQPDDAGAAANHAGIVSPTVAIGTGHDQHNSRSGGLGPAGSMLTQPQHVQGPRWRKSQPQACARNFEAARFLLDLHEGKCRVPNALAKGPGGDGYSGGVAREICFEVIAAATINSVRVVGTTPLSELHRWLGELLGLSVFDPRVASWVPRGHEEGNLVYGVDAKMVYAALGKTYEKCSQEVASLCGFLIRWEYGAVNLFLVFLFPVDSSCVCDVKER